MGKCYIVPVVGGIEYSLELKPVKAIVKRAVKFAVINIASSCVDVIPLFVIGNEVIG